MTQRVTITGVRGEDVGSLPSETRVEIILSSNDLREIVRTGKLPMKLSDELMVEVLKIGRAASPASGQSHRLDDPK